MYIDTVITEEIRKFLPSKLIKGVTTNPTLFYKEKLDPERGIKSIIECEPDILFVQLTGSSQDELKKEYEELKSKYTDTDIEMGIKISIDLTGLEFINYIKKHYPNQTVLGTAIYSSEQGILGALAGCDFLAPYVNRMHNENIDPMLVISTISSYIKNHKLSTKIMGASFKNTHQIVEALSSGAHTVTVPANLLEKLFNNKLASMAIKEFKYHQEESNKY